MQRTALLAQMLARRDAAWALFGTWQPTHVVNLIGQVVLKLRLTLENALSSFALLS